jgi:hypothetical protein
MVIDLKAAFRRSAAAHGAGALDGGDPKETNRAADEIVEVVRLLREEQDQGRQFLTDLLGEENVSVRIWAATYLLPLDAEQAVFALEKAAKADKTIIGFGAEMVLREWRAGRLKLPA